jgi:hypothetical protein
MPGMLPGNNFFNQTGYLNSLASFGARKSARRVIGYEKKEGLHCQPLFFHNLSPCE